jgi:hypothetical protein
LKLWPERLPKAHADTVYLQIPLVRYSPVSDRKYLENVMKNTYQVTLEANAP